MSDLEKIWGVRVSLCIIARLFARAVCSCVGWILLQGICTCSSEEELSVHLARGAGCDCYRVQFLLARPGDRRIDYDANSDSVHRANCGRFAFAKKSTGVISSVPHLVVPVAKSRCAGWLDICFCDHRLEHHCIRVGNTRARNRVLYALVASHTAMAVRDGRRITGVVMQFENFRICPSGRLVGVRRPGAALLSITPDRRPKRRQAAALQGGVRPLMITIFLCCYAAMTTLAQQVPAYRVARVMTQLKIDGRLNERAWADTLAVGNFVNNRDGSPAKLTTEARVLYNDQFIYFAFRAVDPNIWATMKRRDEHLWLEEVVEVFLQASPAIPNYIELEVNPLGTMLDIYLLDTRKPLHYESWNSEKLRWAVHVDGTVDGKDGDREWTCEIALPLEDIATASHLPPQPGDRWRMNLYRVESKPEVAELAWSPTLQPDFHVLPRLGEIVFTDERVPRALPQNQDRHLDRVSTVTR